jgi:hypothetical protein
VPPIPAEIRDAVRARLERDGVEALHAELARRDPVSAERLKPRDRTRIARALEVVEATGRRCPTGIAKACRRCCRQANSARCSSRLNATSFMRGSMRGSTRCWTRARWRKSPRSPRESSIRCCRR